MNNSLSYHQDDSVNFVDYPTVRLLVRLDSLVKQNGQFFYPL